MGRKLINHPSPFFITPVKLTKCFRGKKGEVIDVLIICIAQAVCVDETVKICYISHQEKYGKSILSTCFKAFVYSKESSIPYLKSYMIFGNQLSHFKN